MRPTRPPCPPAASQLMPSSWGAIGVHAHSASEGQLPGPRQSTETLELHLQDVLGQTIRCDTHQRARDEDMKTINEKRDASKTPKGKGKRSGKGKGGRGGKGGRKESAYIASNETAGDTFEESIPAMTLSEEIYISR